MEQENEKPVMKNGIFTIVGLGASAGGLEAYEEFFSQLPANPGCAFVLVMHLDPHHKSMLPDILSKVTGMQVVQAEDGMKVAPNRIHVIPPDTTMFVDGDSLKVEKAKPSRGARKPIDEFFRSLAEQKGDKAVGIIFSGTGSDGTQGLREIKFAGGMSMVQDPSTAKFDAMPANAIQAGVVDVVDSSSELAHKLSEYLEKRGEVLRDKAQRGGQDELEELLDEIHAQTGRDVAVYKRSTLMRRIEKRMLLKERLSIGEYKKFLQENEEEVNELLKELLIGVTSFFRDSEAFETIHKKVLPKIFSEKDKNESVRIWVPGCASGEEAYSIAMLVSKYMEENKSRRKIQIFATDVDDDAIAQARNGIYPTNAVGDVPEEYRERYMNERNGHHQVSTKIREMVVFAPHDLIDNPPFFKLDLISCRNLLIYLNPDVQKRIIPLFFYSLLSGGYLVLGPAETLGKHSELFEPVNSKWKIFQRKDIPSKRVDIPMSSRGAWTGAGAKVQKYQPWEKETSRETRPDYKSIMQDALVRNFAVPSVLINENDAIIQVHGDVHDYFGLTEGDPSSDVYRMARSPLRPHLRSAVHKARSKGEKIRYKGLNFGNNNDLFFNLTVSPADGGQSEKGGILLIAFEPLDKPGEDYQQMPAEVARDELVNQLEEELRISNDQLQSTIENLDSANEELKSSNEELMSMNEELQSSNEELETSQEELQALNEELSTVNSELQAKISELDEAKSDLENLLRSTDIATLFIDRGFVIRQFTPAVTNIFNIEEGDIGRPLKHFANKAPGEDIIGDARNVLKNLEKREKEIRTEDGKWYLSRIFPYRSLDDTIDGVVLTYVDITERKKMEDELREHRDNLEELVEQRSSEIKRQRDLLTGILEVLPVGVFIADEHGNIDMVNAAAEQIWGGAKRLKINELREYKGWWTETGEPVEKWAFARAFEDGEVSDNELINIECFDGSAKTIRNWARPVQDEDGNIVSSVAVVLDVTRERRAQQEAEEGKRLLDALMDQIPEGITIADAPDVTIRMVSRHGLEMIDMPKHKLAGIPYRQHSDIWQIYYEDGETLVPPGELPLSRAVLNGEVTNNERLLITDSEGNKIPLLCNAAPLKDNKGEITGGLIAWRDVSELDKTRKELIKARDRAQAANEAKSAFLANMSHEIRTPLSGMLGLANLLAAKPDRKDVGQKAKLILDAGEQLLAIIDDVLDLSRIEVDQVKIRKEPASIEQLLDRLKLTHMEAALDKGIDLKVTKSGSVPDAVVLDSKRVTQVLTNLVGNSIKFTESGRVEVQVETDTRDGYELLLFKVIDTGIGIPEDKLENIFDSFYQAENYLSKEHDGTGLGLAISKRLAELMDGRLSAESVEGAGSTFTFSLPLQRSDKPAREPKNEAGDLSSLTGLKVLVVEDNKVNRLFLSEMLEKNGMKVVNAEDGAEAVDAVKNEHFDLVLMDIQMPRMDGVEAAQKIRRIKGGNSLKIIALTAYAMQGDRDKFLESGMDEYVAKPVDIGELNSVIKKVTAGKE